MIPSPALQKTFAQLVWESCYGSYLQRTKAVTEMLALKGEIGVNLISEALNHDEPYIRLRAIKMLRKIREPASLAVLLKSAIHPDACIRKHAIIGIRKQKGKGRLPVLFSCLADEDLQVRMVTEEAILSFGVQTVPELSLIIENGSEKAKIHAINILKRLPALVGFPPLKRACQDTIPHIRKAALVGVWSQVDRLEHLDFWLTMLQDPCDAVAEIALQALLQQQHIPKELEQFVYTHNQSLKTRIFKILSTFSDLRYLQYYLEGLHSQESNIQAMAAEVLGQLRAQEAVPKLLALLHENSDCCYAEQYFLPALLNIGGKEVIEALEGLAKKNIPNKIPKDMYLPDFAKIFMLSPEPNAYELALYKLGKVDSSTLIEKYPYWALGSSLLDQDRLSPKETLKWLFQMLEDADKYVRHKALSRLHDLKEKIGVQNCYDLSLKALQDEESWIREQAISNLIECTISQKRPAEAFFKLLFQTLNNENQSFCETVKQALQQESAFSLRQDLLQMMETEGSKVKKIILQTLLSIENSKETVKFILNYLKDKDPAVQVVAAQLLASFNTPEAMTGLKTFLQTVEPELWSQIVEYLLFYRYDTIGAVPGWEQALQSDNPQAKMLALKTIEFFNIQEAAPLLIEQFLKDTIPDTFCFLGALLRLGNIESQLLAKILIRANMAQFQNVIFFLQGKTPQLYSTSALWPLFNAPIQVRKRLAKILRFFPEDQVLPLLKMCLKDDCLKVRYHAIESLRAFKSQVCLAALLDLSKDESSKIRSKCLDGLRTFKDEDAIHRMRELVHDPALTVRHQAQVALLQLNQQSLSVLPENFKKAERDQQVAYLEVLSSTPYILVWPTVLEMLADPRRLIRFKAAQALRFWCAPNIVEALICIIKDLRHPGRLEATYVLGYIGIDSVIDHLDLLLSEPDEALRKQAVKSLKRLKLRKTRGILNKALNDTSLHIVKEANAALNKLDRECRL